MKAKITAIVFVSLFLLSSCKRDPKEGGWGNDKPKDPVSKNCTISATVVSVPCGMGFWGNLWLLSDKGEYFQPCDITFLPIVPIELKEGDKVMFSYQGLDYKHARCEYKIMCAVVQPKAYKVLINCIQVLTPTTQRGKCKDLTTVPAQNHRTPEKVSILSAFVQDNYLKTVIGYSGCNPRHEKISLHWDGSYAKSNPPQVFFELGNLPEAQMCQAYFMDTLCFDISSINKLGSPMPVSIKLKGYDKTLSY